MANLCVRGIFVALFSERGGNIVVALCSRGRQEEVNLPVSSFILHILTVVQASHCPTWSVGRVLLPQIVGDFVPKQERFTKRRSFMKVTFFLVWSMTAVEVLWGRRRNPELDHAEEPEGWWSREELDDPWWSHRTPKGAEPTLRGAWHEDHHPLWHHHYYERRPPSKNNGDLTTAATLAALFIKLFLLKINSLGILKLVILGALFLIKIPLILGFKALILFKALKVAKAVALAPLLLLLLPLLPILLLLPLLLLFLLPVPVLTPPAAAAAGRRRRDLAYPQNQLDTMAKLMEAESCLRRIACHLDYDRSHVREYGLWYRQSKRSTNTVRENFSSSSERKRKQCARQFPCSYFNRPG